MQALHKNVIFSLLPKGIISLTQLQNKVNNLMTAKNTV